jgi:hypothetical protein
MTRYERDVLDVLDGPAVLRRERDETRTGEENER